MNIDNGIVKSNWKWGRFKQALIANKSKLISIINRRFLENLGRNGIVLPTELTENILQGEAALQPENVQSNESIQIQTMESLFDHLVNLFNDSDDAEDVFKKIMDTIRQCGRFDVAKEITNDCKELSNTMELLQDSLGNESGSGDSNDSSTTAPVLSQGSTTTSQLELLNLQPESGAGVDIKIKEEFEEKSPKDDDSQVLTHTHLAHAALIQDVGGVAVAVASGSSKQIGIVLPQIKEEVKSELRVKTELDPDEEDSDSLDDDSDEYDDEFEMYDYDEYDGYEDYFPMPSTTTKPVRVQTATAGTGRFAPNYSGPSTSYRTRPQGSTTEFTSSGPHYRVPHAEQMTIKNALLRQNLLARHSKRGFTFHSTFKIKSIICFGQDDVWYTGCSIPSDHHPSGHCSKKIFPQSGKSLWRCFNGHECEPNKYIPVAKLNAVFCDDKEQVGGHETDLEGTLWEKSIEVLLGKKFSDIRRLKIEELQTMTAAVTGDVYEVEVDCKRGYGGEYSSERPFWNTVTLIKKVVRASGAPSTSAGGGAQTVALHVPAETSLFKMSEKNQSLVRRPRSASPVGTQMVSVDQKAPTPKKSKLE